MPAALPRPHAAFSGTFPRVGARGSGSLCPGLRSGASRRSRRFRGAIAQSGAGLEASGNARPERKGEQGEDFPPETLPSTSFRSAVDLDFSAAKPRSPVFFFFSFVSAEFVFNIPPPKVLFR